MPSFYGVLKLIQILVKDQGRISTATLIASVVKAEGLWNDLKEKDGENDQVFNLVIKSLQEVKQMLKIE